jgi:hypothetical protein
MARQFLTDIELGEQRELRFEDADSSAYVGFKAPAAVTTNRIWTLPATDGTSSQALVCCRGQRQVVSALTKLIMAWLLKLYHLLQIMGVWSDGSSSTATAWH